MPTNPVAPSPCHLPERRDPAMLPCHGPEGRPLAPAWPGLSPVRDLTGLAGEHRARVHRTNVRIREADARGYAEYLAAYLEGARRCRTTDELRAYGPPAGVEAGLEAGASLAEARDLDFEGPFGRQQAALRSANEELAGVILRLERRPVPLDVFFDASLTVRVEAGGHALGGTLSARGGAAAQVGLGPVTVQPGRVQARVDAGVAGARAAVSADGLQSVEVFARAIPGVRGFARLSGAAVEEGIQVGGALGGDGGAPGVRVEARASAGVNLVTADVVRRALSSRSWWDGER